MRKITAERLAEIESDLVKWVSVLANTQGSDRFAIRATEAISDLLAALKQAREERDAYADALDTGGGSE